MFARQAFTGGTSSTALMLAYMTGLMILLVALPCVVAAPALVRSLLSLDQDRTSQTPVSEEEQEEVRHLPSGGAQIHRRHLSQKAARVDGKFAVALRTALNCNSAAVALRSERAKLNGCGTCLRI